ncbi:hypothetical protein [Nesterenkonia alba]|uniref:hypothetical protein n=1 Tax=Nesterenkonia alba TaxID=515814 RepID=UPI0003B6C0CD|nr:hypothetical protein [Nesterenkonia alba]
MSSTSQPSNLRLTVFSIALGIIGAGGVILSLLDQSLSGREATLIVFGVVIGLAAAPWAWLIGYKRAKSLPQELSHEEKLELLPSQEEEVARLRALKRNVEFEIEEARGEIETAVERQFEIPNHWYGVQAELRASARQWKEILRQRQELLPEVADQLQSTESLSEDAWIEKQLRRVTQVKRGPEEQKDLE